MIHCLNSFLHVDPFYPTSDTLQHLETFVFPLSNDTSKSPDEVLPDIPSSTVVSA